MHFFKSKCTAVEKRFQTTSLLTHIDYGLLFHDFCVIFHQYKQTTEMKQQGLNLKCTFENPVEANNVL
jgi:phage terminase small subunit